MSIHGRYCEIVWLLSLALSVNAQNNLTKIQQDFENANTKTVLVAAHRGEHHHYPENSLLSIQAAIDLSVDIVEIDVRQTKDGQLILMHDKTIDRTTNGKGKVTDLTWKQLQSLRLKNPDGSLSDEPIPTLKQVMLLAKGKIMVNLDKSQGIYPACVQILKETGTEHQAILKGTGDPVKTQAILKSCDSQAFYMPIVVVKTQDKDVWGFQQYQTTAQILQPESIEIVFRHNDTALLSPAALALTHTGDIRLWGNSLNGIGAGNKGEHEDELARTDPDATWGWLIAHGISVIQTDEPERLLQYLRSKGLHD